MIDRPDFPDVPEGMVVRLSPLSVEQTVAQLTTMIEAAGAKLFTVVDHSGEAATVGMKLRDTKLLVFGSPVAGTPIMDASPTAALDLPLKVLVWADDDSPTWMGYLSPDWLAVRHEIPDWLTAPLAAVDALTARIADAPAP